MVDILVQDTGSSAKHKIDYLHVVYFIWDKKFRPRSDADKMICVWSELGIHCLVT